MWELDYKESWVPKNWCFWTVVLEKTLESPLDCEEIQPVHPKGNMSWIFTGRTDAEAETPIFWLPDVKNWLIGEDLDAGKDWGQGENGVIEDKMVGWHHRLNRYEFEQSPGVGAGQGSLVCWSPWGCKESDMTEWLNWTELKLLTNWWRPSVGEHDHGGHVVTTDMGEDLHRLTNTPSITCLYVNVRHDRDDTKDGREKLGAYFCKSLTLHMK